MKTRRAGVISTSIIVVMGSAVQAGQWYKGDLHSHSIYSDGDSSVQEVLASAEQAGLDFFALTDHDRDMNGIPTHWFKPDYDSSTMVLLYGIEWTKDNGHANVWGATPFNYSALWAANQAGDAAAAVNAAHAAGCLFSINHPLSIPWRYSIPANVDGVEVWNGPMLLSLNILATYRFWDNLLLQGQRLAAFGGSDTHNLKGFLAQFQGHGKPTTWAYAEAKTPNAILAALGAGRTTISHQSDGTRVELKADIDRNGSYETMMGANVSGGNQQASMAITFSGTARSNSGKAAAMPSSTVNNINRGWLSWSDYLWLAQAFWQIGADNVEFVAAVKNGKLYKGWLMSGGGKDLTFTETMNVWDRGYYRVELYGKTNIGGLAALVYGVRTGLTSPIYVNF